MEAIMAHYHVPNNAIATIAMVLENSVVKGSQALLIVSTAKLFQHPNKDDIFEIPDVNKEFLDNLLSEIKISGRDAPALLEAIIAISKPVPAPVVQTDTPKTKKNTTKPE